MPSPNSSSSSSSSSIFYTTSYNNYNSSGVNFLEHSDNINNNQKISQSINAIIKNIDTVDYYSYSDDSFDSDSDENYDFEEIEEGKGKKKVDEDYTNYDNRINQMARLSKLYKIYSMPSQSSSSSSSLVEYSNIQKRLNIIYELLTTEEKYINDLYFILKNFRSSLWDLLTDDEEKLIFRNLDKIYEQNCSFFRYFFLFNCYLFIFF